MQQEVFTIEIENALRRAGILNTDPFQIIGRKFRFESTHNGQFATCAGTITGIHFSLRLKNEEADELVFEISSRCFHDEPIWRLVRSVPDEEQRREPWRLVTRPDNLDHPVSYPGILMLDGIGQPYQPGYA